MSTGYLQSMAPSFVLAQRHEFTNPVLHISKGPTSTGWSSIIGIVVAICGNIIISFALNTQRYAHIRLSREKEAREERTPSDKARARRADSYGTASKRDSAAQPAKSTNSPFSKSRQSSGQNETRPLLQTSNRTDSGYSETSSHAAEANGKEKNYLSSPWWWLGITLMVIGECGNFLAYGFAPASIVSPLGVVALVSNCLIAPWMLHEKFRLRDAIGVLIAIAGCVIVVLSASGSNPKLDADEIWRLISTWEFETYFGITAFLIIALMYASSRYGEKSILIDLGLVGLFGGYTALATKGVASLLSNTIWRVVTFPVTYLLVAILVFTAIMQIKYVNRSLQRFNSTQVIPTQFVLFTLSVIIGSAILYRDFERKAAGDAGEFFAGCALTFLGVYCITSGRSRDSGADHDADDSEDEEGIHLSADDGEPVPPGDVRSGQTFQTTVRTGGHVRTQSSRSDGPLLRVITADDDIAEEIPPDLLVQPLTSGMPGVTSAIHHNPSRMVATPPGSPRRAVKPRMHATTSDPVIPAAMSARTSKPKLRHSSITSPHLGTSSQQFYGAAQHERPRTPENQSPYPDNGSMTTPRFGSIGRHSIVDILPHPGPLTNPLSNSLSAIVADSLRKGVDIGPGGSMRRRSLRGKRSRRFDEALTHSPLLLEEDSMEETGQSPAKSAMLHSSQAESIETPVGQNDLESRSFGHIFGAYLKRKQSTAEQAGS